MELIALMVFALAAVVLVMVGSIKVRRTRVSKYELLRRSKTNNASAKEELRRELLVDDLRSLLRVIEALLLVALSAFGLFAFGIPGLIVVITLAIFYGRIGFMEPVREWVRRLYEQIEPRLLNFVEKMPQVMKMIRSIETHYDDPKPSSREEVVNLIESCGTALPESDKKLLVANLTFADKRVEDVMTPRGVITALKHDAFIGPLALNDLHQSGHGRFPVMKGDIDNIIGILYLHDLVTLSTKESKTAEELMDGKVYYIEQTQTLREALAAFLHVKHHMFIVINEYRETAGILTLEDVMEAMIGQKIIDEFDVHDDMRLVAERSAKTRNNPPKGENV